MKNNRPPFANWLGETNDITRMFLAANQIPDMINMAGGLPESSIYPQSELADLAKQAITKYPGDSLDYGPIEGLTALRELIALRFSSENLPLNKDNVLITTGGMQGLDLVGKALLDEDDIVACQSPAYLGALDAWRPRQPIYRPFFPEEPGFNPTEALTGAKFAYTVPNFSNPSGKLIDSKTRRSLVAAAKEIGTWLIEDDPYGTLYYDHPPLERMISLSGSAEENNYSGPIIYLGTLSKELAPGFRVGWAIADKEMIASLTVTKQGSDMCSSGLTQRIAYDALTNELDRQTLPKILDIYRGRRDQLCKAMEDHLSDWFHWEVPVGGMFVWAVAKKPNFNTDQLLKYAMQEKVCVTPSSVFDPEGNNARAIRINFTRNPEEKLIEGVRRIALACRAMTKETI